jgi:molecular chaperone GrpE
VRAYVAKALARRGRKGPVGADREAEPSGGATGKPAGADPVTDNVKRSKRQVDDDQVSDDTSRAPDPVIEAEADAESAERKAPAKAKARRESSGSGDQSRDGEVAAEAEDGTGTAEAETDQPVTGDAEEATGAEAAEAERAEEAAEAEEAEEVGAEEPAAASDGDAAEAAEPVAAADAEAAEADEAAEAGEDELDEVVLEVVEDADATEEQSSEEAMADLVAARAEAEGYLDDLRRLQAEFDNYRKRTMREQSARIASAAQSLVSRLLPVLDNFELAVSHAEQSRDFDRMLKGVEMVFGELQDLLSNEGLVGIEAEGKPFDPERHEAVVAVEEEGVEAGTVIDVIRKGYEFNGRVLRPAMVKVAR